MQPSLAAVTTCGAAPQRMYRSVEVMDCGRRSRSGVCGGRCEAVGTLITLQAEPSFGSVPLYGGRIGCTHVKKRPLFPPPVMTPPKGPQRTADGSMI
jgi:hypothetical protein